MKPQTSSPECTNTLSQIAYKGESIIYSDFLVDVVDMISHRFWGYIEFFPYFGIAVSFDDQVYYISFTICNIVPLDKNL